jgi:hypothetical protein
VVLADLGNVCSIKKKSFLNQQKAGPLGLDEREFLSLAAEKSQSFSNPAEQFSLDNPNS